MAKIITTNMPSVTFIVYLLGCINGFCYCDVIVIFLLILQLYTLSRLEIAQVLEA